MSEFQFHPLPTPLDYQAAFEITQDTFAHDEGVRSHLMRVEYTASHGNYGVLYAHVQQTGSLALHLEPKDERGIALDRSLTVTHAFKRGMLAGFYATFVAHDGSVSPNHIRQLIDTSVIKGEVAADDDTIGDPPILELGNDGLKTIGEPAVAIVENWAHAFYDEEKTRRLFRLGTGAVVAAAYAYLQNENLLHVDAVLDGHDWSKELDDLNRANTGE